MPTLVADCFCNEDLLMVFLKTYNEFCCHFCVRELHDVLCLEATGGIDHHEITIGEPARKQLWHVQFKHTSAQA